MLDAYAKGDVTTFNKQLADYRTMLAGYEKSLDDKRRSRQSGRPRKRRKSSRSGAVNFEVFFNQFSPFYYAAVLYLVRVRAGRRCRGSAGRAAAPGVDLAARGSRSRCTRWRWSAGSTSPAGRR